MIEEGVIMAISVILSRLTNPNYVDLVNPLLRDSLGMIEDISSFDEREEEALSSHGIVPRLISLLTFTVQALD